MFKKLSKNKCFQLQDPLSNDDKYINRFTIVAENLKLLHKAASENGKTVQFQLLYNKCSPLVGFYHLLY